MTPNIDLDGLTSDSCPGSFETSSVIDVVVHANGPNVLAIVTTDRHMSRLAISFLPISGETLSVVDIV